MLKYKIPQIVTLTQNLTHKIGCPDFVPADLLKMR